MWEWLLVGPLEWNLFCNWVILHNEVYQIWVQIKINSTDIKLNNKNFSKNSTFPKKERSCCNLKWQFYPKLQPFSAYTILQIKIDVFCHISPWWYMYLFWGHAVWKAMTNVFFFGTNSFFSSMVGGFFQQERLLWGWLDEPPHN